MDQQDRDRIAQHRNRLNRIPVVEEFSETSGLSQQELLFVFGQVSGTPIGWSGEVNENSGD